MHQLCGVGVHITAFTPVGHSGKGESFVAHAGVETHIEVGSGRTDRLHFAVAGSRDTVGVDNHFAVVRAVLVLYGSEGGHLEDSERFADFGNEVGAVSRFQYVFGHRLVPLVPQLVHLAPVLAEGDSQVPFHLFGADRSQVEGDFDTFVGNFANVAHGTGVACFRGDVCRDDLVFGQLVVVGEVNADAVAEEIGGQAQFPFGSLLRFQVVVGLAVVFGQSQRPVQRSVQIAVAG